MKRYGIHIQNDKAGDRTYWADTLKDAIACGKFFRMNKNNTVIIQELIPTGRTSPDYMFDKKTVHF